MLVEELWQDIDGYEGLYMISNLGRVKSLHGKGRILKQSNSNEYSHVSLYKNGNGKTLLVHRLVGNAFVPNPENKPEINHKDGNKRNNVVTNLEWVTARENQNHSILFGLKSCGENAANNKLTAEEVQEIRRLYVPKTRGCGCRALAKKYGVNSGTIWSIVNGRYWRWN